MDDGAAVCSVSRAAEEGRLRTFGAVPQGMPVDFAGGSADCILQPEFINNCLSVIMPMTKEADHDPHADRIYRGD
jgi:hypothetical protein